VLPFRPEALAKTVLDFSKVAVGAAFASEFFAKYALLPRVVILIAPFLLIWLGIWLQPSKKELESP
jgi:hypothetical protein